MVPLRGGSALPEVVVAGFVVTEAARCVMVKLAVL
jgi:hypothetical protein